MKKFVIAVLFLFSFSFSYAQIWSENFDAYISGTGVQGPGIVYTGDYPDNVTKWTLDVSGASLTSEQDYFKTSYNRLEARDVDGPVIWQSESIDMPDGSDLFISLLASESGSMETSDYFDVYYKIDDGSFIRIPNWQGYGSGEHTLVGDFSSKLITQSTGPGDSLRIKVVMNNDSSFEYLRLDDVSVEEGMTYLSSTTIQNAAAVGPGVQSSPVIRIEVETTGSAGPLNISAFTVNANGSSVPVENNIENAKIFYTGTSSIFDTASQFGETVNNPAVTDFDITGDQDLLEGINHFWLTYDVKATANTGEIIDAECISFELNGVSQNPDISAPAGARTISGPLSGEYTIGAGGDYENFTMAVNELTGCGISSPVVFSVLNGTYMEQIEIGDISGANASDTIVFQSLSGNPEDVVLQYEPEIEAGNFVVSFNGVSHVTFLNMTIQNAGVSEYGTAIIFRGETSHINICNNHITGRDIISGSNDYSVIYGHSETGDICHHLLLKNNTIQGGSKGIRLWGQSESNLGTGTQVIGNEFQNFSDIGIFLYYQDSPVVDKNILTANDGGANFQTGIIVSESANNIAITKNQVFLSALNDNYGISLYGSVATADNRGLIANNFTSMSSASFANEGIGIMDCGYLDIFHNTVLIHDGSTRSSKPKSGTNAGISVSFYNIDPGFGSINILNNIIHGIAQVLLVNELAAANGMITGSNYNVLYTLAAVFGVWGETECSNLQEWQTASGLDNNSTDVDPQIESTTNPTPANSTLQASVPQLPQVLDDIYDIIRPDPTTPGSVEIGGGSNDKFWTGDEDNKWNNPNNWSPPGVPGPNDNVHIEDKPPSGRFPQIFNDAAECNNLNIDPGAQITISPGTLNLNGDLNNNLGTINSGSDDGGIVFKGDSDASANFGDASPNVDISKSSASAVVTFESDTQVSSLVITSGKADLMNNNLQIMNDGDFSGGSISNSGEVKFTGSTGSNLKTGGQFIKSVIVDKDGNQILTLLDLLSVENLKLNKGGLNAQENNVELTGDGDFSGGEVTNSDSIKFKGVQPANLKSGGQFLKSVIVNKQGAGKLQLQDDLSVDDLNVEKGKLEAQSVEVQIFNRMRVKLDSEADIKENTVLKLGEGIDIEDGGTINLFGAEDSPVTLQSANGGSYSCDIKAGGVIGAGFTHFKDLGPDGVCVQQNAAVDPENSFNNCTFSNGQSGGTFLTLDNGQDIQISGGTFNAEGKDATYNIRKTVDAGSVTVINYSGDLSGSQYEDDPYDRIHWDGEILDQDISLTAGWNAISSYLIPENPDIQIIFQPIVDDFIIAWNYSGVYCPSQSINTLQNWNSQDAFLVKTSSACILSINGEVENNKTIVLNEGWNLLPVLSENPVDVEDLLMPVSDKVQILKEGAGPGIFWPDYNINTIGNLMPGSAYYISVTEAIEVSY